MKKTILSLLIISLVVFAGCQQAEPAQDSEEELFRSQGSDSVTITKSPNNVLKIGNTYEFTWEAVGGQAIRDTRVQASNSPDFSQVLAESNSMNNGPGIYKGNIMIESGAGSTVYVRAIATIDGQEVASDTMEFSLQQREESTQQSNDDSEQMEQEEQPVDESGDSAEVQEVNLEAFQYGFEPNPIRVNKGTPVRVRATSTDVDHGISIPQFGVSQVLPAGETVVFEFTPDKSGEFTFFCNVYCGSGHSSMKGTLIVE